MHINVHIAIGIIITSILNYFFNFSFLDYSIVLLLSFVCDFDIFLTKLAKNQNHRLYITHSLIPSIILIIIGIIIMIYFNYNVILLGGLSYMLHIIVDTFDWGTNLFYFPKRQNGFKFLMSLEESENLSHYLSKYKNPSSFFDTKYYTNRVCIAIEICLFCAMLIAVSLFALKYFFFITLYFIGLGFHLSRHFHLKKSEKK